MENLFSSGRIVEIILVLAALEGVALYLFWKRTGRGVSGRLLLPNLLAGLALMFAIYLALTGAWWGWLGLALLVALLAHVVDLAVRWRG